MQFTRKFVPFKKVRSKCPLIVVPHTPKSREARDLPLITGLCTTTGNYLAKAVFSSPEAKLTACLALSTTAVIPKNSWVTPV